MKIEQTECSETSAYEIQMPGNHPEKTYNRVEFDRGQYGKKEFHDNFK
jgi:hypothetical protein